MVSVLGDDTELQHPLPGAVAKQCRALDRCRGAVDEQRVDRREYTRLGIAQGEIPVETAIAHELLHPAIEIPCDLIELGLRGRRQGVKSQRVALRLAHVDAVGHGGMIVQIEIGGAAGPLDRRHCAAMEVGRVSQTELALGDTSLPVEDAAQEELQDDAARLGVVGEEETQRWGKLKTNCRYGTRGKMESTRWVEVSAIRLPRHDGQNPLPPHENPTTRLNEQLEHF